MRTLHRRSRRAEPPVVCHATRPVWSGRTKLTRQTQHPELDLVHGEVDDCMLDFGLLVRLPERRLPGYRYAGSTVLLVFQ
jgi:hypothetical protein